MIRRLYDYEPPSRDDGQPWTRIVVEESSASEGQTWVQIEDLALLDGVGVSPQGLDADPKNPMVRNVTTDNATLEFGWYRVIFKDGVNSSDPSTPVTNIYDIKFRPTIRDVGVLLRSRTKTEGGQTLGTFTSATMPTSSDVRDLIRQAANRVGGKVGYTVPNSQLENARSTVALGTALLIELGYFSEQVATNRSPYSQLKTLYDDQLKDLVEAVGEAQVGEQVDAGLGSGYPSHGGWPTTAISMEEPW